MCLDYSAAATKTESQCNLQGIREKRSQQPGGEKTWLVHLSLNSGVPAQHFQWLSSVLLLVLCLALLATTSRGLCVARSVWSGRHSNEIESGFFGLAGRQIARPAFKLLELSSPPPHPPPPLSLWTHIIMYTLWSSLWLVCQCHSILNTGRSRHSVSGLVASGLRIMWGSRTF